MDAPIREAFVAFTPVTPGGNQSRGDNGYWKLSKMVLLSELAAHLEGGRLRIINTPMGQRADLGTELVRGRLHVGREYADGRALQGSTWRFGDRDGAGALVGGRQAIREDRGRRPGQLLPMPPPANRGTSNEQRPGPLR
jgi:hypothetical protein